MRLSEREPDIDELASMKELVGVVHALGFRSPNSPRSCPIPVFLNPNTPQSLCSYIFPHISASNQEKDETVEGKAGQLHRLSSLKF